MSNTSGVRGCKQYNTNDGYEFAHPYFLTSGFENAKVTSGNVTQLRMGVLGNNDGHIRLSPKEFPFDNTEMHEIGLFLQGLLVQNLFHDHLHNF